MERGSHIRVCAVEVGVLARRVLGRKRRGKIAAVFERSLYAVFGDDWICIGAKVIGSGPLHVLCEGVAYSRFSPGQEITATGSTLVFGGMELTGLDAAPSWSPRQPPAWTGQTLQAGIAVIDHVWRVAPAEEGLAASGCAQLPSAPSHVLAAALPGIAALRRSTEARQRGREPAPADEADIVELIGLGPGLTPSGDDFLAGALLALANLGLSHHRDALWSILRGHLDRTNDISAAHLRSAAAGYAASALHEAIDATISGRVAEIAPALAALSGIGHCSGRDAFAGALVVLRAIDGCVSPSRALQQSAVAA